MGFLVLIVLIGVVIVASSSSESKNYSGYHSGYIRDYDVHEDHETSAVRGEREYFSDDPASDYGSYYTQLAEVAEMGDENAMDEIRGESGDEVW